MDNNSGIDEGVQYMQSLFYKGYLETLESPSIRYFTNDGKFEESGKDEGVIELDSYQYDKIKSENTKLQEDLASTKQKYDSMSASYYSTKKAESVLIDDYLDEAVVVRVGDDKYYHRLNCPTFPNSYSYHFLIPLAAQSEGYSKCTKCFDVPAKQYISNNF